MTRVSFTVEGAPVGKGRPRACRAGSAIRMYQPPKTERYESLVRDAWRTALQNAQEPPQSGGQAGKREGCWQFRTPSPETKPHEGPVCLTVKAFFPIPKSRPKRWRELAAEDAILVTTRPDLDNVLKILCDGLNAVAWRDDAQIAKVVIEKRYSRRPRLDVQVSFFAGE